MPKEIYEWLVEHPGIKVELYYDKIFNQLGIHMVLECIERFHLSNIIESFEMIEDVNNLLFILDHMYEKLVKHKEDK